MQREHELIAAHYGDKKAARSGVLLMRHITEGLAILSHIKASDRAKAAFCLHPLLQDDAALAAVYENEASNVFDCNSRTIALTMEYRKTANAYLAYRHVRHPGEIQLSPLPEVQQMLIADKVQNRKDFLRHFTPDTHVNYEGLRHYFNMWLGRLEVSEHLYEELCVIADNA